MNGVKFFVNEVISGKLVDGAAVYIGSAVLKTTDFGQVGGVVVFEAFIESELASELLQFIPQLVDVAVLARLD